MSQPQFVAILGSTGSIGTQALEVISRLPEQYAVSVLTAHRNVDLLIEQARTFQPAHVVIGEEAYFSQLKEALADLPITVHAGEAALTEVMDWEQTDIVLTAVVGFVGLKPTVRAIQAGKRIALANKETLVVAGQIISDLTAKHGVEIIPVDSEHSALFQCVVGEADNPLEKIYLTASGGPFRGFSLEQLKMVTKAQALKHPNWEMGAKITIDSASMMNKGLEVIEAKWLFDLKPEQIDVIVHPQSIIHSMVQFEDGSMKAQMGLPDMRLPIQYGLTYPARPYNDFPRFNFLDYPSLTFERVDMKVFKNLELAYRAMEKGGNAACILNAANEVTNQLFRAEKIRFTDIGDLNEMALEAITHIPVPSLEDLHETDRETRRWINDKVEVMTSS
ncbi:MAG: 1-deoxy-D-xylulose-5-phosphate reductoisomerase [Bacteroidota bacterium]